MLNMPSYYIECSLEKILQLTLQPEHLFLQTANQVIF